MSQRFHDRRITIPDTPWDHVHEGVWVGGSERGYPRFEFLTVVSVYDWHDDREAWLPPEGTFHLVVPMMDAHSVPADVVEYLADQVEHWRLRGSVLVRCQAGLNRSSLVVARWLTKHQGWEPTEAIGQIRRVRSPDCLFNDTFVNWLEETGRG